MVLHLAAGSRCSGEWQTRCQDHPAALSHVGPITVARDVILTTTACCLNHRELPTAPETEAHKSSHRALHLMSFRHHPRDTCCVLLGPCFFVLRVPASRQPSQARSRDTHRTSKTHICRVESRGVTAQLSSGIRLRPVRARAHNLSRCHGRCHRRICGCPWLATISLSRPAHRRRALSRALRLAAASAPATARAMSTASCDRNGTLPSRIKGRAR